MTISILATNDIHGQLERLPIAAGYVANLRNARKAGGGVLLVDAGDAFQGTIESNLNEGASVIAAFNAMGYQAFALGNHEFDFGPAGPAALPSAPSDDPLGALKLRLTEARFPILSANLRDDRGALPAWQNLRASALLTVAGVRVGVIGLLTAEAKDVIKRPLFPLRTAPLAETASAEAARLRAEGAELVILLAHAGGSCKRQGPPEDLSSCSVDEEIFRLARALPDGAVDAIVGGHRNAAVAHRVGGIPIVHAPSHLVALSRIDLVYDRTSRKVLERRVEPTRALCQGETEGRCEPGQYEGRAVVPDAAVQAVIAPALDAARGIRARPVGVHVEAEFPVSKRAEFALGNLFADLMRDAVPGADAAFANAGSIRDRLPAGDLTFGQLYHVMPFDNRLARLRVTGAELRSLIRENLTQQGHGSLSWSGLRITASCAGAQLDLDVRRADGTAIADDTTLALVTNDFVARGGDGLLPAIRFPEGRIEILEEAPVLDTLERGLARRRSVRPDDPTIFDPSRPRVRLSGSSPLSCR